MENMHTDVTSKMQGVKTELKELHIMTAQFGYHKYTCVIILKKKCKLIKFDFIFV